MDRVKTALDDLGIFEDSKNGGRLDKRKKHVDEENDYDDDDDKKFKSKNLEAERRRRKKLGDRQLELRSLVPIITNMNKATIITDAITYIEELKKKVEDLSDQLHLMEATCMKDEQNANLEEIDAKQEMKKWGLTPEVQVIHIDGNKLWTKIVFQKKRGGITRLIEAMNALGFDLTDTSITTSQGAVLVTSSVEGIHGGVADAAQIKEFLLETINSI